jgi:hypothetical protein
MGRDLAREVSLGMYPFKSGWMVSFFAKLRTLVVQQSRVIASAKYVADCVLLAALPIESALPHYSLHLTFKPVHPSKSTNMMSRPTLPPKSATPPTAPQVSTSSSADITAATAATSSAVHTPRTTSR